MINGERKVIYTDGNENLNPLNYEHLDMWVKVSGTKAKFYYRTDDGQWDEVIR